MLAVRVVVMLLVWGCAVVQAQQAEPTWLTVAGEPENPAADTVQVDPGSIEADEDQRTMRVRVSRSTLRTSWDGVPYRSYESSVRIDCRDHSARYLSITFYPLPRWQGASHRTVDYSKGPVRAMGFRDIVPNPNQRIVVAACASSGATRR